MLSIQEDLLDPEDSTARGRSRYDKSEPSDLESTAEKKVGIIFRKSRLIFLAATVNFADSEDASSTARQMVGFDSSQS